MAYYNCYGERIPTRKANRKPAPPGTVHLSARAIEWLRASRDPVAYKGRIGVTACENKKPPTHMCQVQDVRAMLAGYSMAHHQKWKGKVHVETLLHPVEYPDCPTCLMLLNDGIHGSPRPRARGLCVQPPLTAVPPATREPQDL